MAARRSLLPARRTRLIGREAALDDIRDRVLHGDRRLMTLTGAGGTGKTTLALEVARRLEAEAPDGAWFVDLSVVRDPDADEIALAWSAALGIVDQERPPRAALAHHLAARQALVVLDNCEHLAPALAGLVDTVLDRCPDVRILATSRAALRVRDESVYVVPPFAVPASDLTGDADRLAGVEAVQLFVERAAAVDPAFALTSATAPAVASICRRLDGIPLAIELAAAMVSVLAPLEIDERLAAAGGLAPVHDHGPERQRTMDATLDWSHDLLEPATQALFRRLAVFSGPWSLDAAEQIGSLGVEPASVLPRLGQLVDHSLVVRDGDGPRSRYRMLAPIAEYASRKLAASDELGPASIAHGRYFLQRSASPYGSVGECLPEDLDRLEAIHENCLAAIRFAERAGIVPLRLGLIRNLVMLWRVRGHLRLGMRLMEDALDVVAEGSPERAVILGVLAEFGHVLGEYDTAEARAREAEAIFGALGDPIGVRTMIGQQGMIAAGRGDYSHAIVEFERARPLVDAHPGDLIRAYWHAGVGRFSLAQGDLAEAERHLQLARDHFGRQPSWYVGRVLASLGTIARRRGDLGMAASLFAEALDSLRAYGATVEAIACLEDTARLAMDRGEPERAATLLGAATGLRDATAAAPSVPETAQRNADIDAVRSNLAPRDFDAAWTRGLALTLGEAVAFGTTERRALALRPAPRGSTLTPREREIAELVALGLTNREVAERLVIAPGTVKIHVERILGKLGRTSRVQIATWALEERDRGATDVAKSASRLSRAAKDMPGGRRRP